MLSLVVLIGSMVAAADGPVYPCPRVEDPIVIDGILDGTWEHVPAITDFILWDSEDAPTYAVSVRLAYDDNNLYAFFHCEDPDIFTLYSERDAMLWEADVVELFFQPKEDKAVYYEFEISPDNVIFDARFVNRGSGGFKRWAQWNCDIESAVSVMGSINDWQDDDTGYTVELAIPLEVFGEAIEGAPIKGQTWDFAAVRMDFSKTLENVERSATARVEGGNMHDRKGWAKLRFESAALAGMRWGAYTPDHEFRHIYSIACP